MDCQHYQDALNAAAVGSPSGGHSQAFGLHLEICPACRRELERRSEFLGNLDRHIQLQLEAEPAPDFNARLRRRILAEAEHTSSPFWKWGPAFAAAAALVILLAILHFRAAPAPQPTQSSSIQNSSSPQSPNAQFISPDNEAASPQPNADSGSSSRETLSLHPVALPHQSAPALEVRINPRETYAAAQLARAAANGQIDAASLPDSGRPADKPMTVEPLEIPALEVQLLDPPSPSTPE
jgi:hypothetical protein